MLKNKKTFVLFSVLFLILGTLLFVGCGQSTGVDVATERILGTDPNGPTPFGTWISDYYDGEVFDINEKMLSYEIGGTTIYAGIVCDIKPDQNSKDSGIIYIQYTIAPYGIVGNYYAVRWERYNPITNTVWLSGCADANGKKELADAEAEYSEANKGKYFATGSDCHLKGTRNDKDLKVKYPGQKPAYLRQLEEKTGLILVK